MRVLSTENLERLVVREQVGVHVVHIFLLSLVSDYCVATVPGKALPITPITTSLLEGPQDSKPCNRK